MRAQLRPDARQQDRELEGLGDIVIGARVQTQNGVAVGVMAGQHHDRAFHGCLAHALAQLAPIGVGQANIQDHKVILALFDLLHALGPVAGLEHVEILGHHQLFRQGLAQVIVVIHQQDLAQRRHLRLHHIRLSARLWQHMPMPHAFDKNCNICLTRSCRGAAVCFNSEICGLCRGHEFAPNPDRNPCPRPQ